MKEEDRNKKRWTVSEIQTVNRLFMQGKQDKEIAKHINRSTSAVQQQRMKMGWKKKVHKGPSLFDQPNKGLEQGKYTRVEGYTREVSFLWGMIKYTKR